MNDNPKDIQSLQSKIEERNKECSRLQGEIKKNTEQILDLTSLIQGAFKSKFGIKLK
jgi:peptidoglycan hydrolase CwlO-like protein